MMTGWRRWLDEGDGGTADAPLPDAAEDVPEDSGVSETESPEVSEPGPVRAGVGLREYVREKFGRDLSKYKTDDDAIQGFLEAQSLVGRRQQEAEYGRRYLQHQQEFEQWQAWRQQQAMAPPQPQQQPESWWNPPKLDMDEVRRWVTRGEDGQYTYKDDTPYEVRKAVQDHDAYVAKWEHQLRTNPTEAFRGVIAQATQEARRQVLEELRQHQVREQEIRGVQAFEDANAGWMYEMNDAGQRIVGDNGGAVYTPAGQYFMQYSMWLRQQQPQLPLTEVCRRAELETRDAFMRMQQQSATPMSSPPKPPANVQRRRQPTGGTVPGELARHRSGGTIRDKLMAGAKEVPDEAFMS